MKDKSPALEIPLAEAQIGDSNPDAVAEATRVIAEELAHAGTDRHSEIVNLLGQGLRQSGIVVIEVLDDTGNPLLPPRVGRSGKTRQQVLDDIQMRKRRNTVPAHRRLPQTDE